MVAEETELKIDRADEGPPEKLQGGVVRGLEGKADYLSVNRTHRVSSLLHSFIPCCITLLAFVFTVVGYDFLLMDMRLSLFVAVYHALYPSNVITIDLNDISFTLLPRRICPHGNCLEGKG